MYECVFKNLSTFIYKSLWYGCLDSDIEQEAEIIINQQVF